MRDYKRTGLVDGTTAIDVSGSRRNNKPVTYLIQFTGRDAAGAVEVPAAGTCVVNASVIQDLPAEQTDIGSVDLTDRTKWLQITTGSYDSIDLVIASLTALKTIDVLIRAVSE